jgi:hypothetical protein
MENRTTEHRQYDRAELERLWKLKYSELIKAPSEPKARLREARFVMQAKVASETRLLQIITALATAVMAVATIVMAIGTFR